jgi:hypothetical protein
MWAAIVERRIDKLFAIGFGRMNLFTFRSIGRRSGAALRRGLRARPPPDPDHGRVTFVIGRLELREILLEGLIDYG